MVLRFDANKTNKKESRRVQLSVVNNNFSCYRVSNTSITDIKLRHRGAKEDNFIDTVT